MENKNNNFAILALVAIVAVIGVVSLVMMMNVGPRNVAMTDGNTVAGQAFGIRSAPVPVKAIKLTNTNVDDSGDGSSLLEYATQCTLYSSDYDPHAGTGHCVRIAEFAKVDGGSYQEVSGTALCLNEETGHWGSRWC